MERDLAPMMRKIASVWNYGVTNDGYYVAECPFCTAEAQTNQPENMSIILIHDEDCPAAFAAK